MVRCSVPAAVGFAVVALLVPVTAGAAEKPSNGIARCHFVKKNVHGKVRKVRVCAKKKPPPKPAARLVAQATLDGQIAEIADGFGSLWAEVISPSSGAATVERIDPTSLNATARIPAGADVSPIGSPVGLAVGTAPYGRRVMTRIRCCASTQGRTPSLRPCHFRTSARTQCPRLQARFGSQRKDCRASRGSLPASMWR